MTTKRAIFWLVLALPAAGMVFATISGQETAHKLLHPSGEFSIRLMIVAMLAGPLNDAFGPNRFFRGWIAIRRNLGVAAFMYAVLHLVLYFVDLASLSKILGEFMAPAILTGWLATAFMLAAAATSFNRAVVRLGRARWKMVQRSVYFALLLTVLHWGLLDDNFMPAIGHIVPLLLAWAARAWVMFSRR